MSTATIDLADTERLRRLVEGRRTVRMWSEKHRITPRLVDEVFGAGDFLLAVARDRDRRRAGNHIPSTDVGMNIGVGNVVVRRSGKAGLGKVVWVGRDSHGKVAVRVAWDSGVHQRISAHRLIVRSKG
jgi:hypothetical protein